MDDVWIGPGLTRSDFDEVAKALSLRGEGNPPLLGVTLKEDRPCLAFASHALFDAFETASADALALRMITGPEPGAKRLATLLRTLPLDGAPRLERLRFLLGPGSEVITFLCRRVSTRDGGAIFVAAALGVRADLIAPSLRRRPEERATDIEASHPSLRALASPPPAASSNPAAATPAYAMSVQAIQATLRARWPSSRRIRFLWQTDENAICTLVTQPLRDVVGPENASLVNRNLLDLAPMIDPSGRLAEVLNGRSTWSGLDVAWPIAGAAAGVAVGLGAIPAFDRERGFEGFRGYGVIHLDKILARDPAIFTDTSTASPPAKDNVVAFRGGRSLSAEDQLAFDMLGAELRHKAGLIQPVAPVPASDAPPAPPAAGADEAARDVAPVAATTGLAPEGPPVPAEPVAPAPVAPPPVAAAPVVREPAGHATAASLDAEHAAPATLDAATVRLEDVGRNGPALLDRLAIGLLVSRDNVPIFANRHLLDLLGFADEDALHEAGGMTHLFGDQPGNVTGSEAVGIRDRAGTILPTHARMQRIEWDGLPATLLTLHPAAPPEPATMPAEAGPDASGAGATMVGENKLAPNRQRETAPGDQAELRELRAVLETASDGVAIIDAHCNVVSLNRSAEALFGCDRGAVVGKPFLDLFASHNQGLAADYFRGIQSSPTKSLLNDGRELLIKARQGGTIPVLMTLGRLGAADAPEGARFCALFRDLTHWKKVQGELERAKQDAERASALKSDFLAKVSHEVRTPLNAIIGFAEVILEERFGPLGNERYKDYLRDIHGSGTHVMSLVNDLLDLSKIEAGKMDLTVEAVDANKIIAECVGTMQPQASRERVIMRLSLAPTLPRIKADARSLRQIVLNLLSNAVKFNEPGGQVIVATTATEDGKVVIRIRDTGPGMSESDITAALEPFRQLSNLRRTADGTGLGLPLTKALVEANEASFAIRSRLDHGTMVEVSFPPARVLAG